MSKETVFEKGRRLLDEGRVEFVWTESKSKPPAPWSATDIYKVFGDSDVYRVESNEYGIFCDCPARRRCSHEIAVFALTTTDG